MCLFIAVFSSARKYPGNIQKSTLSVWDSPCMVAVQETMEEISAGPREAGGRLYLPNEKHA